MFNDLPVWPVWGSNSLKEIEKKVFAAAPKCNCPILNVTILIPTWKLHMDFGTLTEEVMHTLDELECVVAKRSNIPNFRRFLYFLVGKGLC